ncbi:MAG: hypothetical protein N3D12_05390 [Candidatus Methanomethyliaceae archaeon]|nr:hypothetical protein [Candidatus Methanomethyliaceae archaeon]
MDYKQGMIDGLELALDACCSASDVQEVKERIRYYLVLANEEKLERIRLQLGVLK